MLWTVADIGRLQAVAAQRGTLHREHASSRPLSEGYELVGLVGEAEFSRVAQMPMDLTRRPGGDGRVDFVVPLRFTVDVKTFRNPGNLIQEIGKVSADIYVLAKYHDDSRRAELLGWEWGSALVKAPTRDFGYGIVTHYIAREELRPMSSLLERIMRLV